MAKPVLLHGVLPFLDTKSLVALRQVNRGIAAAAKSVRMPSVVVDQPYKLGLAVKQYAIGGITNLTLRGGWFYYEENLLKGWPPSTYESVRELSVPDVPISIDQLATLKRLLPNLESLNVGCTAKSRQELASTLVAWEQAARATTSFKVTLTKVRLEGADFIAEDFRRLPISVTELEVSALASPGDLPSSLRYLKVHSGVSAAGLAHLTQLTELSVGWLHGSVVKGLSSSLRVLDVRGGKVSTAGLGRLTQLTKLDVPVLKRQLIWNFGPNILPSSLQILKVWGEISASDLTHLTQLIRLDVRKLTEAGPKVLPSSLRFVRSYGGVSAAAFAHLTQLTELDVSSLKKPLLWNFGRKALPASLLILTARGSEVSVARLAHLNRLTELQVGRLTGAGAIGLPSSLRVLEVYGGGVSAAGLAHLTQLTKLRIWKFTKAGAIGIPSSLRELSICEEKISAADLARLRAISGLRLYLYDRPKREWSGGGGGGGGMSGG